MPVTDGDGRRRARRSDPAARGEPLVAPAAILEGLPDAVVAIGGDARIVFVNALAEELFGYPRDELLGQPVEILWPEAVRARYRRNMELYFATQHPLRFTTEAWGLRRDGVAFPGEMSWGVVETDAGPLLLAIGRDISERRAAEARLRAVASIGEHALAGADSTQLAGAAVEMIRTTLPHARAAVLHDELVVSPERELTAEETSFVNAVANTLATGLARLRDEERVRYEAVHDPLTGLANRTLLRDRLEHAIGRSRREGGETAVLFVDLDNFKQVNDAYGHAVGDAVLASLGDRLRTAVRPADTVARLGGDEFVVVCEQVDEAGALASARRLEAAIRVPLAVDGVEHCLTASIGIALGHSDPDELLGHADEAVYRAKAANGGRLELYRSA
jgi:diguanylate cyclase (GGDEF)-like protein/PAS domain S-box-containing protein